MKNLKWWGLVGVAAMSIVVSGCGSSSSDSNSSSVRVANATLTHPSLDLLVNGSVAASATTSDTISGYVSPSSGSVTLQLNDAGAGTALATAVPTLTGGLHYTLLAYESGGSVKTAVLNEDYTVSTTTSAQLRFYNAAPDAGKLDVYVTDPSVTDLSNASALFSFTTGTVPASSALYAQAAGTYKVWITGNGNKADIRIVVPSVVLAAQQIGTVILTPASGGVLLNGSTLIQQSTYSAARNTNARLRLASAVSGNPTVQAAAGSLVIDDGSGSAVGTGNSGTRSPSFNSYVLVPAASALNISVNGASVGAPATALAAGSDATLFVYGSTGAPVAKLLLDDNRAPTDTTAAKIRVIDGLNAAVGNLTLTANNALVANGVQPGAASAYASVPGSSTVATTLSLTASLAPNGGAYYSTSTTILPGTVYTILTVDSTNPAPAQFLIR